MNTFGRKAGIGFVIFGLMLLGINYGMLNSSGKYFPKFLVAGAVILMVGLAMLVVPGNSPDADTPSNEKVAVWWKSSPLTAKVAWIVAGLAGLAGGFYLVSMIDPRFF